MKYQLRWHSYFADVYYVIFSGTNRYFRKVADRMNIETTFIDATDPGLVRASMKPNTKVRLNRLPTLSSGLYDKMCTQNFCARQHIC